MSGDIKEILTGNVTLMHLEGKEEKYIIIFIPTTLMLFNLF